VVNRSTDQAIPYQADDQQSVMSTADLENRYYAYLRGHAYSTEAALDAVLAHYVHCFAGFTRVLDVGCGHGEFLRLLRDAGHEVAGVDVDPAMVAACRAQGFDVAEGDAAAWLRDSGRTFDGIFSSNVVEHMTVAQVAALVEAAFAALRPGGLLLLATPNPESAIVQGHEFWRDPTHVRLYSRQLLEFMLHDAGFEGIVAAGNPASAWEGVDAQLATVDDNLPLPPRTPVLPPLPPPPGTGATWRERTAWRVSDLFYHKFTEPYLAPLRAMLEEQRGALEATQAALDVAQGRIRRLSAAYRFLHPEREIYVVGYKPVSSDQ
jgi:O-antigen chain-terminating methyltransferase